MSLLLLLGGTGEATPLDPPASTFSIDWDNDGDFDDADENVSTRVIACSWTRGRSADFSTEAIGAATLTLTNDDGFLTTANVIPGLPVHVSVSYASVTYAIFYGFIERANFDPRERVVEITCYDPLGKLAEMDVVVPATTFAAHSARTMRRAVLEDAERGTRNLVANPSFETNTTGWTQSGTSLTRITSDFAPSGGIASGEFIASASGQRAYINAYLAPILFEGEIYRGSFYARVTAGTATWKIGLGPIGGADTPTKNITLTTTWTRFTITYTVPTGIALKQSTGTYLPVFIESTAAGTARIDNVSVTRGVALHPYADVGVGRWPNWLGNGDFEGLTANGGWVYPFRNLVANPRFETNATGWTAAARSTTAPKFGAGHGSIVALATATYTITASFVAGVTYDVLVWWRAVAGTANPNPFSFGNGGDIASATTPQASTTYGQLALAWTPGSTVASATFSGTADADWYLGGLMVTRRVSTGANPLYSDTGPGGGGVAPTSVAIWASDGKYGRQSFLVDTPATADSGVAYDFNHYGPVFVSGQQYILSLWVLTSSAMPYEVGIGANKGDGTWDEATTTGTTSAGVWTQITRTWTPSADRDSSSELEAVVWIVQTDATARAFRVDGVRVIPGGTADAFEEAHWDLDANSGEASDLYAATAELSGSAGSALATLNGLTLTRHWIRPEATTPWYSYVTEDRVTVAAKASSESFVDSDVDGFDFSDVEIDRSSIVNVVAVSWDDGTEYYSDSASVGTYGTRPGGSVDGAAFYPDRTIPDTIGPALVERYADGAIRPTMTVENRWPSQFERELNDLVTVTAARAALTAQPFLILRIDGEILEGGLLWRTAYTLEEA